MTNNSISIDELRLLTAEKSGVMLLDVRTPEEFDQGHVPGALSFPLGNLDARLLLDGKTVSSSRPVYLICHTQNRSRIAAERFVAAGHPQVFIVAGGTAGWMDAGLPLASEGPKARQPSPGRPVDGAIE